MSLNSLLNTTVDIQTQTQSKSATGGATILAWTNKAAGVVARVSQLGAETITAYGALGYKVTHRVYFDTNQSLTIKDRVVFQGKAYEVRSIDNAGGHLDRLWQVDCELRPI